MFKCKCRSTLCEQNPNAYLTSSDNSSNDDMKKYRKMMGSLVYAMTYTHLDINYLVTKLSQHFSKPDSSDRVIC